jgi:hypothetical protein
MSAYANKLQANLFEPNGENLWLADCFESNPVFLFRVHAPETSGQTELTFVASTAAGEGLKDVLQLPKSDAKSMIMRHLTRLKRGKDDDLMSWASSPLFTIQYSLFRAIRSDPSQVRIFIVDSSELPAEAFMPVVPLLNAYDITKKDNSKLDKRWFHEEYLSQGRLHVPPGAMKSFTLGTMIDHGLFDFFPAFGDKQYHGHFYRPVKELRCVQPKVPTPDEMKLAVNISEACCSATKFRYMLFASLLAIKSGGLEIHDLADIYRQLRTSKYKPPVLCQPLIETRMGSDIY